MSIQVEEADRDGPSVDGKPAANGYELIARSELEPVQVTFRFENLPLFTINNANNQDVT